MWSVLKLRGRLPILEAEPRNAAKLMGIVGNECQVVGESNCGDQQVVRADQHAFRRKVGTNSGRDLSRGVVEGQRHKVRQGFRELYTLAAPGSRLQATSAACSLELAVRTVKLTRTLS